MKVGYPKMTFTGFFVLATGVIWAVYDLICLLFNLPTISEEITKHSFYTPTTPLILGVLIGHFFWPVYVLKDEFNDKVKEKWRTEDVKDKE